jgi:hypothetical protein
MVVNMHAVIYQLSRPIVLCAIALCSMANTFAYAADLPPLGRMLSTPAQRELLDKLRKNTGKAIPQSSNDADDLIVVTPRSNPQVELAKIADTPSPLLYNGFVKRSDGINTTWLNQQAVTQFGQATASNQQLGARQIALQLPSGQKLALKPGQIFLPEQAVVTDTLGDGQLKVKPAPSTKRPP